MRECDLIILSRVQINFAKDGVADLSRRLSGSGRAKQVEPCTTCGANPAAVPSRKRVGSGALVLGQIFLFELIEHMLDVLSENERRLADDVLFDNASHESFDASSSRQLAKSGADFRELPFS